MADDIGYLLHTKLGGTDNAYALLKEWRRTNALDDWDEYIAHLEANTALPASTSVADLEWDFWNAFV